MIRSIVVGVTLALLVRSAWADEAPTEVAPDRRPLVERPMILPPLHFQPTLGVAFHNLSPGSTAETLSFGIDVGISRVFQAGFDFDFPVNPQGDFGLFVANLQARLAAPINVRLDVGAERLVFASGAAGSLLGIPSPVLRQDAFVFGVGLPLKWRLGRMFAIVSGSTAARGFGAQQFVADRFGDSIYGGSTLLSGDLLTMVVISANGGTHAFGTLTLPIGVLFQPHAVIALGVRTAYRMSFEIGDGALSGLQHYVPLAFDAVVSVVGRLDIGFTATLSGFVGNSRGGSAITLPAYNNIGYADYRVFEVWLAAHL